jgi:hypothetical protein
MPNRWPRSIRDAFALRLRREHDEVVCASAHVFLVQLYIFGFFVLSMHVSSQSFRNDKVVVSCGGVFEAQLESTPDFV